LIVLFEKLKLGFFLIDFEILTLSIFVLELYLLEFGLVSEVEFKLLFKVSKFIEFLFLKELKFDFKSSIPFFLISITFSILLS